MTAVPAAAVLVPAVALALALLTAPATLHAATGTAPAATPAPASASADKPAFLIVGTFHFRGSSGDLMGNSLPDVATPRRQKEIEAIVAGLARFKPTKIAVEYPVGDSGVQARYQSYRKGERALGNGEAEQIGFRLAKQLGHERIWPVDHKLDMDFGALMAAMQANGQSALFEQGMAMGKAFVDGTQAKINDESVGAALRFMNDPKALDGGHGAYLLMAQVGTEADPVGARVVSGWYERNLRIYGNLVRAIESPNERVLLLIGAGHAKLLRDYLALSPNLRLEEANAYLP